jgi:hypothetical protein
MIARILFVVVVTVAPACTLAQNAGFELRYNGKVIGRETYTFKKTKQGFRAESKYSYAVATYDGRFDNEYHVDSNYLLQEVAASNLNTNTHYHGVVNKSRTELAITVNQNGTQSTLDVPIRPDIQLLTTFDPACAQLLLLRAVIHPTADNKYNIIVPSFGEPAGSRNGGGATSADPSTAIADQLPSSRQSYDAAWEKSADVKGVMNGKPVVGLAYTLVFGTYKWIFIADDQQNLLQMNVGRSQPTFVRQGFTLDTKDLELLQSK